MTKRLPRTEPAAIAVKRGPTSWSFERRARQSALIHRWQPWRRSTGPKTDAGKARAATNALKHGLRSRDHIETRRLARHVLRLAAANLKRIKAFLRAPHSPISTSFEFRAP